MTSLVRFLPNYCLRSVCQSSPPLPDKILQNSQKPTEGTTSLRALHSLLSSVLLSLCREIIPDLGHLH